MGAEVAGVTGAGAGLAGFSQKDKSRNTTCVSLTRNLMLRANCTEQAATWQHCQKVQVRQWKMGKVVPLQAGK